MMPFKPRDTIRRRYDLPLTVPATKKVMVVLLLRTKTAKIAKRTAITMTIRHKKSQKMNDFVRLTGIWDDICPFQIMTITDDQNGLTLEIEDNRTGEKKGRFRFTAHHAYRNFNEADLFVYLKEIGGDFKTGLYMATSSELLKWAAKQSVHDSIHQDIKHYMVVSVEDVLEVLSFKPPEFEAALEG